ncbi:MAG: hypothetical protein ACKO91_16410 [Acidimicrobiales bacterium]
MQDPETGSDVYLTPTQVAAQLGVTARTVRNRLERGELTGTRSASGRWLVAASSLRPGSPSLVSRPSAPAAAGPEVERDLHDLLETAMLRSEVGVLTGELALAKQRIATLEREVRQLRAVARSLMSAVDASLTESVSEPNTTETDEPF